MGNTVFTSRHTPEWMDGLRYKHDIRHDGHWVTLYDPKSPTKRRWSAHGVNFAEAFRVACDAATAAIAPTIATANRVYTEAAMDLAAVPVAL